MAASLVFVAMLLAALSLWTALPLTWVYIGSKVSETQFPAEAPYAVVIVGLIASIVLVAWLISRLNRLYIQITGTNRLAPMRPAWMRSMRDTPPRSGTTTVVEAVLMGSVLLAGLALSVWFFLLAGLAAAQAVAAQTTNLPSSCMTSPSTSILPPRRRSQTRSVWTADSFVAARLRDSWRRRPCGRCRRSSRRAGPRGCRGRSRSWCRSRARRGGGRRRRCRAA